MLHGKSDILHRARERFYERERKAGHDVTITPEESELKETGDFREAQTELMRNQETETKAEMAKYLNDMAGEMGLVLMSKDDKRRLEKMTFVLESETKRKEEPEPEPETLKIPQEEKPEPQQKPKTDSWLKQIFWANLNIYLARKRAQKAAWDQMARKLGAEE